MKKQKSPFSWNNRSYFGTHLMYDGYGARRAKLGSLSLIYRILDNAPRELGMTMIAPPYVFRYIGLRSEDWGITGVVLIAESHCTIHTFPEKGFISADFYSCKSFDVEGFSEELTVRFGCITTEVSVAKRGKVPE